MAAALLLTLPSFSQDVALDRTWFLAGETMTVRVTGFDATIAYAELCDTHGMAAGTIFRLKEGVGAGIIELPADLHSG